jgi:hypothetical protein
MNTKNKNLNWFFIFLFLFLTIGFVNAYDVNITFYDEFTLEPIPTVTITDANTSIYTSDVNGLWATSLTGAKDLTISKTGYGSRKFQFNFTEDTNFNFALNPTGLDSSIGFIVKDTNSNLWNNKYLQFKSNYRLLNRGDITTKAFNTSIPFVGSTINAMYLNQEENKIYFILSTSTIGQYNFTKNPLYLSNTGKVLDVSDKETNLTGFTLADNGTKLYIVGSANDKISYYTLSIPYDIESASFVSDFAGIANPYGVQINKDGTIIYIRTIESPERITNYSLSTPWDVSTASLLTYKSSINGNARYMYVSSDDKYIYLAYNGLNANLYQYELTTPGDLTTLTLINTVSSISVNNGRAIFFNHNLSNLYQATSTVFNQFDIGTETPTIINSLLTSSTGTATANISSTGDYNALLYTADGNLTHTYTKTNVTVNKPKEEINPANSVSPYDKTVNGLLEYSLTNQTADSVDIGIFAGAIGNYIFTVVDYNANPLDRQYLERSYIVKAPMGIDYVSSILYQPYLIGVTDVIVPRIYVLDQLTRTIQDAEIYISTNLNFTETIVESGLTDGAGVFMFSAIPLKNYYVSVYYEGVFKGTYLIKPRTSDDVFFITVDRTAYVDIAQTLMINIDFSDTVKQQSYDENLSIKAEITSNYDYLTGYNLKVYQGNTLKYDANFSGSGSSITIDKEVDMNLFQKFQDVRVVVTAKYTIDGVAGTQSVSQRISIFASNNRFTYFTKMREEVGQPLAILLSIILTAMIVAIITFSGLPIPPAVTGVLGILVLGIFAFMGWLDLGVVAFGVDIGKILYILLVGVALYFTIRIGGV